MLLKNKDFLISKFNTLWPDQSLSPTYKEVQSRNSTLFNAIINRFGSYSSFLRRLKRPIPKNKSFTNISSKCSNRHHHTGWSTLEEKVWSVLVYLGVATDFVHNCPFPSPSNHHYRLDFYNIDYNLCLEVDGLFHKILPSQKARDNRRDEYLESCGIFTLRLSGDDISNPNFIQNLQSFLCHHYD